jgi:ABC-2 type transport system permease protein
MIRKILSTAAREYKATALTKGFIFATFVLPVLMWVVLGALAVFGLFDATPSPIQGSIGVIDRTRGDVVLTRLEERFDPERIAEDYQKDVDAAITRLREEAGESLPMSDDQLRQAAEAAVGPIPEVTIEALPDETEPESQTGALAAGELIAVIAIDEATIEESPGQYTLLKSQGVKARVARKIESAVEQSVISERFVRADLDLARVNELRATPRSEDMTVSKTGETTERGEAIEFIIPVASVLISIIAIFTGAGYLLTSTVEEKSSRVMEVLLSAISPIQLMTGKLIGQGLVGLTTFLVYSALGIFAAIQFGVFQFISPMTLVLLVAYFLIGYFMYAALFAAVGSAVSDMREAQALQGPLFGVMFLFIYAGMFAAINDPNNTLSRVLGLVPLSAPFVMPMRVANPAVEIPAWEVWGSLALGVLTVIALVWLSAKIFRVGVLMYGKPPSLIGLFKWIRYT